MPGLMTTSVPGSGPSVPGPRASTTPAPSAPSVCGFGRDGLPRRIQMSMWLSALARRRTRASPGPGSGTGTSVSTSTTSGPPSSWIRTARTAEGPEIVLG